MDQHIQTVSTGFLELCINCFGPLLDSTLKKAYLHSFGLEKGRSIFIYFDSTGKWWKRLKNSFSVFETEEIIEMIAEKQQASLKSFFSFCVLWPFCCNFKNKTLQVDMGIEPTMVLWFRSKIQSESLQLSKVFIDTHIGMSIMYKSNIQFTCK